ncbi:4-carboxy-4-hydroxy-2-oxoadipate aldolase/oxaloacetate decarboxylase [Pokkaliibacter plantistimulans]|uniref:4-hydroxy-4-methyl-2-oxoglutarate aldolase n=1 Tax=Proteobacteria bacterium 228 TaxID=2083153 RepID=A0A2S5KQM8_9PROT|nr:4-carboxy-4-hydroxy-2-oxoadipate aldolase/oxaloacetate decarboxylase [Pokkaliibacter plantistimulans]PPC76992.1 4-carboxy-4-hydroxy-2-oxoadipate aldolase/oxaloacetate decarboxylase [Pokkaliibacter plantistimulans]
MNHIHQLGIVKRNIQRTSKELVAEIGKFGVATLHEAMGRLGLMKPYLRPIFPGARICGTAVTVLAQPGDNWMLHVAAEQLQDGDVAVVGCTTENDDGMFGDLLATSFKARGARGLITDAGVRDVATLTEMNFPVFSRAIHARGAAKAVLGSVNVPVICAGQLVTPGDVVVADDDGVLVIPRELAEEVLAAAAKREANEEAKRLRFATGELGLDIYNMREPLARLGLKYID